MSIPTGVCRISLIGQLAGIETFDCSFWVDGGASSLGDVTLIAGNVAALVNGEGGSAPLTQTKSLLNSDSGFTQVRVYGYASGGPTATYVAAEDVTTGAGTGDNHMPLQVSLVVSLRTARAGRSYRGRIYLPANSIAVTANYQVNNTAVDLLASEWVTFLGQVENIAVSDGPLVPVVVSQTQTTKTPLTSISVDTRVDIQRRRANKQVPAHTASEPFVVG